MASSSIERVACPVYNGTLKHLIKYDLDIRVYFLKFVYFRLLAKVTRAFLDSETMEELSELNAF